jgi:hypothetical protein
MSTGEQGSPSPPPEELPFAALTLSDNNEIHDARSHITPKELSECDREKLHHIGFIQGGSGHLIIFEYPCGKITAHDRDIRNIKWIRQREGNSGFMDFNDGTSSLSSSQSSLTEEAEPVPLLGAFLHCWIPYNLYMVVTDMVVDMKKARSQRAFNFFTHRKKSYAISLSTTVLDYSIVSMEIELAEDGQEVSVRMRQCTYS